MLRFVGAFVKFKCQTVDCPSNFADTETSMKGFLCHASVLIAATLLNRPLRGESCPRPGPGEVIVQPEDLFSANGRLDVQLSFRQDAELYCYVYNRSVQAPTLRVHPGDELILTLKNELPRDAAAAPHIHSGEARERCVNGEMTASATNLHFHGLSVPPTCGQDDVLRTVIPPSSGFEYRLKIPLDQTPGLYWYDPHPHGFSEAQVLGGASGALIVEGIERAKPAVAGLPERILILRDQKVPGLAESDEDSGPGKDISLNFVPIPFPLYRPAEIFARSGERELWRVLNASADTYFDLQIRHGPIIQEVNEPQPVELIGLDGAPVGDTKDALRNSVLLPPGGRAEFIATMQPTGTFAQLVTLKYDTGPDGSASPYRVIANIRASAGAPPAPSRMSSASAGGTVFRGLENVTPARRRKLYFSEERPDLQDPAQQPRYFITVEGRTPRVFSMDSTKPDIVARQGTVEDWTIENRAREAHVFHIHQIHFQLLERDGVRVHDASLRDTIDLPYWDGKSAHYPSVKLRMDFRSREIAGTFVFHCHILEHEDGGMMGSIRVAPGRR
jgi:FtsP/CotA-like multicopper oxidase with cupredoxin domain